MTHRLHASVNRSAISLEIDPGAGARLLIDGAVRASQQWSRDKESGFYLTTPLQTAYEYHALVEARALPGEDGRWTLLLCVDGQEIARGVASLSPQTAAVDRERAGGNG